MASFILIHGSWHGGWCFDGLRARLEAAGHEVIAPDLPGMGGDEATLRATTLAGWAEFAADLCRQAKAHHGAEHKVVLAGHSRGGLVVSQAAEYAPEAIDALVHICAIMLPAGMSRAEVRELGVTSPGLNAIVSRVHNGAGTVVDPARGPAVFAQLSPPELVAAAMARLVAEPNGPTVTPLALTAERFGTLPRAYIECTEDRTIPLSSQRKMQQLVPGARVVTLASDHSPFLCVPDALCDELLKIGAGGSSLHIPPFQKPNP